MFNPFKHDISSWDRSEESLRSESILYYEGELKNLYYYTQGSHRCLVILNKRILPYDVSVRFFSEEDRLPFINCDNDEDVFESAVAEDEYHYLDKGFRRHNIVKDVVESKSFSVIREVYDNDEKIGCKIVIFDYKGYQMVMLFTSKQPTLSEWYTNPLLFITNYTIYEEILNFARNIYSPEMYPLIKLSSFVEYIWLWAYKYEELKPLELS